jgi:serine protease Do
MTLLLAACLAAAAPLARPGHAEEASLEQRIITVSEAVTPSVVHIQAIVKINDRRSEVTGSGVIATSDGIVLTNQHVVERAQKVEVNVPGRKQPYPAEVLGTDKQTDLAVLRVRPDAPLPAARFGDVSDVRVGQWVLAIGNPYGLDGTVSLGIVSAKGRNLEIPHLINDFIQTDAMIDRGSSGGPLVDLAGRVVGINSRGQGRGIGFTIPVDVVLQVMEQLRAGGVDRGWLGISIQPLDRDLADYLGIPDASGVILSGVTDDSPAARAGLRPGDVVTSFAGTPVDAEKEEDLGRFQRLVAGNPPGTEASVEVLREKRPRTLQVTLGHQPNVEPAEAETELGFHVQEITEGLFRAERLASRDGAYVSFVARGSPAAEAGLMPGDVVVRLGEQAVTDLDAFRKADVLVSDASRVLVRARRGDDLRFVLIQRGVDAVEPEASEGDAEAAAHPH